MESVRNVRLTSRFDPKLTNTADPSALPLAGNGSNAVVAGGSATRNVARQAARGVLLRLCAE